MDTHAGFRRSDGWPDQALVGHSPQLRLPPRGRTKRIAVAHPFGYKLDCSVMLLQLG